MEDHRDEAFDVGTSMPDSSSAGAAASIAPTGHLVLMFPTNQTLFLLSP